MRRVMSIPMIAETGADSWMEVVASFRRTAAEQIGMLPEVALVILVFIVVVLNWKLAKRLPRSMASSRSRGRRVSPPADAHDDDHRRAA